MCPPPFHGSTDTQDDLTHLAILVPNALDSDMTASTQRRAESVELPPWKKIADFISIGLSRQLVPGRLDARCAEYSRPKRPCAFSHTCTLSNVPTRCRKVYADCVNSFVAPSVNDSCKPSRLMLCTVQVTRRFPQTDPTLVDRD